MFKKSNILFLSIIFILLTSCKSEVKLQTQTQIALGTVCSIKLEENVDSDIYKKCFSILNDVEKEISRTNENSYISILNREKEVVVNQDVFDLFELGITLAKQSNGKFNIAMGSVVSLWDIGGTNPRIPSNAELNSVNIDYNQIQLDRKTLSIKIPSDMQIDLGALGKGYAADKLRNSLVSKSIDKAIINLGGNVLVIGRKDIDNLWTIGLQDPLDTSKIFAALEVESSSIVTSGTYERFFYQDGVKYHHILDPDTLYPCKSDIISSSIIGKDSLICDCLSTTCFLLGSEQALEFMKNYKDYSAFFLLEDNSIVLSDNFNYEYKLKENH